MKRLLVLVLLLVLGGCRFANQPDCGAYTELDGRAVDGDMCESRLQREYALSAAFTADQQEAIIAAGDAWHEATGGRVALSWRVVDAQANVFPDSSSDPSQAGGYNNYDTAMWIRPDIEPYHAYSTALHELGHSFGLGHAEAATGEAMSPYVGSPISAADIARFDRLWADRIK